MKFTIQKFTSKNFETQSVLKFFRRDFHKERKSAFTLIEIMVVTTIMVILTVIVYASFTGAKVQSRDNQKVSDMNVIQLALATYFNQQDPHQYPQSLSTLVPQYIPSSINLSAYNYVPLTKVSPNYQICTSYQLWTTFEQSNKYLQSKRGFDSSRLPTSPQSAGKPALYLCGSATPRNTPVTNASSTQNALEYDVMPQ